MDPPRKPSLSSVPGNRPGRIHSLHSLYTNPMLHMPQQTNLEVTQLGGLERSLSRSTFAGSVPGNAQKDKDKDKDKEGIGNRLLNMLRKTLKGSESEVGIEVTSDIPTLVPFGDVVGCLAVHVKSCKHIMPTSDLRYNNLFIRISINNLVKFTKIHVIPDNEMNITVKFNEVKYFSIQVPRRPDDERNNIYLELMQSVREKIPVSLGRVQVHLYEVIQKGSFTEELQMFHDNTFVCRLEVEFMFSYGNFGYGFSHQLKPLPKMIERSMFMTIPPPPERTDPATNVIMPCSIGYPAFLSPELNVSVGKPSGGSKVNRQPMQHSEDLQEQPRERLEQMKKEYRNLGTWIEKVNYLENVLTPKLEHKVSKRKNSNEESENPSEEKFENISESVDVPSLEEKAETVPGKLPGNDHNKSQIPPTLSKKAENSSNITTSESEKSTKQKNTPLLTIPSIVVISESDTPLTEDLPIATPNGKTNGKTDQVSPPPEASKGTRAPSTVKRDSLPPECSLHARSPNKEIYDMPTCVEAIMEERIYPQKNANVKEKSVFLSPKGNFMPHFRSSYPEFKPTSEYQKFNRKDGFDPLLRDISNKITARKTKEQDMFKCKENLSGDVIEHEDQDPPYPTHSKTARPTDLDFIPASEIFKIKPLDIKNNLACDPDIASGQPLNIRSKLSGGPNITSGKPLDSRSKSAGVPDIAPGKPLDSRSKLAVGPDIASGKPLDSRSRFPGDPDITSGKSLDSRSKLAVDPDNASGKPLDSRSKSAGVPDIAPGKPLDSRSKLAGGPYITPGKSLDSRSKLTVGPDITSEKPLDSRSKSAVSPDITSEKPLDSRSKLAGGPYITPGKSLNSRSKLTVGPDITSEKPLDSRSKLAVSPDIASGKPLDSRSKLAGVPDITSGKPLDSRSKLAVGPDITSEKPLDSRSKSAGVPDIAPGKPLDSRSKLAVGPDITPGKSLDSRSKLTVGPDITSEKPLDSRSKLAVSPDIASGKPLDSRSKLAVGPDIIPGKSLDSRSKLTVGPDITSEKPLDSRSKLAVSPDIASGKPLDSRSKLAGGPYITPGKPLDSRSKLAVGPDIASGKSLDSRSRLAVGPDIASGKPLDSRSKLVGVPDITSGKSLDSRSRLAVSPDITSGKPLDSRSKLAGGPYITPGKSLDSRSKLAVGPDIASGKPLNSRSKFPGVPDITSGKPLDSRSKLAVGPDIASGKPLDSRSKLVGVPDITSGNSLDSRSRLAVSPDITSGKPLDSTSKLAVGPDIASGKPLDSRSKLAGGPYITPGKSLDSRSKLTVRPETASGKPLNSRSKFPGVPDITSGKPLDSRSKLAVGPDIASGKPLDSRSKLAVGPDITSGKPLDSRSRFPGVPDITSGKSLDSKSKLAVGPDIVPGKPLYSKSKLAGIPDIASGKPLDSRSKLAGVPDITSGKPLDTRSKLPGFPDIASGKPLDSRNKFAAGPYITPGKPLDSKSKLVGGSEFAVVMALDTNNKLAHGPDSTTEKATDTENKLNESIPNVCLPNFEVESSMTGKVNTHCLSKSLTPIPNIENSKQLIVLKPILGKNLQDLLDEFFAKQALYIDDSKTRKESHSSSFRHVPSESTSSLQNQLLENSQDLNTWDLESALSSSPLSQTVKDIATDLFSKSELGNSTETDRELFTDKYFEAGEVDFPVKRKHSFKKKHLQSEVSVSKVDLNAVTNDYDIKQIFTAPNLSKIEVNELSETQMNLQNQLPTALKAFTSNFLVHYQKNKEETELQQAKSVISQIIQSFPVDTLLESGIIKVVELEKEYPKKMLQDTETASTEDISRRLTKGYSDSFPEQKIPLIRKETIPFNSIEFIDKDETMSAKDSKYQSTSNKKTDLPNEGQRLGREENDLSSTLEVISDLLTGNLKESDIVALNSLLKNMLNVFFKYSQSERRPPEKELERLISHSFLNNTKDFEAIKNFFDKADNVDRKSVLNPKLYAFLEELSESEIKNFKSELSKHIQHYLVEKLSESGHITTEDLPKIYQNLYLMNKKTEPEGQNVFLEKYSKTVKEIMSFLNNFNHHFIDKHLEIKLRSFLTEILQNYFLKNFSENSLFKESEPETLDSNMSSPRTKSTPVSFHDLEQDISGESFDRRLGINMKYPLNKSLQNYLIELTENELLNIKANLRKLLQGVFIEKLSQSGLITESQLEKINQHINLINSNTRPLKFIKPDLAFDEHQFMESESEKQIYSEESEQQNKYSKIFQKPKDSEDRFAETDRKEENKCFPLHNIKEKSSVIRERKRYYPTEGSQTLNIIKVQPASNKNIQMIPLNKTPEIIADTVLKKQKKETCFMQLPGAENNLFKTELQDPHSWGGISKIPQPNTCVERTLKAKFFEKNEHNNICKLMLQEQHEAVLLPSPGIPNCKMLNKEYVNKFTFPPRQSDSLTHFNSESGRADDQYCQRLKGNNNNNKKQHLMTFSPYKKEMQSVYTNPDDICSGKYAKLLESHPFKYKVVESEKNLKSFLFPEVFRRENRKSKVHKERDHANKQKKSRKMARMLPTTLSSPRSFLRKSVPKTLLHWTARRTIHDCSDRFEELPMNSFQHLEKAKSRTRLLGKSLDDGHHQLKHFARPYTAPEVNKRRESYTGKHNTNPRMVSAGLVFTNDTIPDYEIHKLQHKKLSNY